MRVPLSWLREYVDVDLSPEALAERLTLLGMEVKGIERRGDDWRDVVVGELLAVEPHPNADRLSLTRVRVDGGGGVLSIVFLGQPLREPLAELFHLRGQFLIGHLYEPESARLLNEQAPG